MSSGFDVIDHREGGVDVDMQNSEPVIETDDSNNFSVDEKEYLANFPILAFLGVVFVVFFIFYKFVISKKKRLKHHNSNPNLGRKSFDKGKLNH